MSIRWIFLLPLMVALLGILHVLFHGVSHGAPPSADLRIITTEEPPTNFTDEEGLTGITTDVVNEIRRRLNLTTTIEVLPWARAYQIASTQPGVVIFTAAKTAEREALGFTFIGPVVTRQHELWARSSRQYRIESLDDIESLGLTLGAMRDDWRAGFFKELGIDVQEVPSHEQNLQMLMRGRFDLWVTSNLEAPFLIRSQGVAKNDLESVFVFKEAPSYILVSAGTRPEILAQWEQTFARLQHSGFLAQLAEKWGPALGYQLEYQPHTGLWKKR